MRPVIKCILMLCLISPMGNHVPLFLNSLDNLFLSLGQKLVAHNYRNQTHQI